MNIKFSKVLDVKSPNRGEALNGGTDFYIPSYSKEFVSQMSEKNKNNVVRCKLERESEGEDLKLYITIGAHSQVLIPSGIKCILPKGKCLLALNKSGVASKQGLIVGACLIDENYRGQIHLNVVNTTNHPVVIEEGKKLIQFIELDYGTDKFEEIELDQFEAEPAPDSRGEGGFGSTTLD